MQSRSILGAVWIAGVIGIVLALSTSVASGAGGASAIVGPISNPNEYIFSAPPRESEAAGKRIYEPIAAYLSRILGKKVLYESPESWGVYQGKLAAGHYDFTLTGPQFAGWLAMERQYNVLARLPGHLTFVLVVRRGSRITRANQVAGNLVCDPPPPNLATLVLQNTFGPARQPHLIIRRGWPAIFRGLIRKRCNAAMMPRSALSHLDPAGTQTRVLITNASLPNLAFVASPRVPARDQAKVMAALLSSGKVGAFKRVDRANQQKGGFLVSTKRRYVPYGTLLRDQWGFMPENVDPIVSTSMNSKADATPSGAIAAGSANQ